MQCSDNIDSYIFAGDVSTVLEIIGDKVGTYDLDCLMPLSNFIILC